MEVRLLGKRANMTLVGFLQAQNCSNLPGSWRHPEAIPDFLTADHYVRIARTLEEGKFHLAFFDDRLAMPDIYGDDYRTAVKYGIRSVKMDLIPLLTAMGMATRHIGLGGTYSTTYYEPFHVARTFQTLDLMVGGRAAWNVVTSLNDSEAVNMGAAEHLPHDMRYDRADEFIECVLGHWNSWEDDALVVDQRPGGIFAGRIERLHHIGGRVGIGAAFQRGGSVGKAAARGERRAEIGERRFQRGRGIGLSVGQHLHRQGRRVGVRAKTGHPLPTAVRLLR